MYLFRSIVVTSVITHCCVNFTEKLQSVKSLSQQTFFMAFVFAT